jgi:hypothetical protein
MARTSNPICPRCERPIEPELASWRSKRWSAAARARMSKDAEGWLERVGMCRECQSEKSGGQLRVNSQIAEDVAKWKAQQQQPEKAGTVSDVETVLSLYNNGAGLKDVAAHLGLIQPRELARATAKAQSAQGLKAKIVGTTIPMGGLAPNFNGSVQYTQHLMLQEFFCEALKELLRVDSWRWKDNPKAYLAQAARNNGRRKHREMIERTQGAYKPFTSRRYTRPLTNQQYEAQVALFNSTLGGFGIAAREREIIAAQWLGFGRESLIELDGTAEGRRGIVAAWRQIDRVREKMFPAGYLDYEVACNKLIRVMMDESLVRCAAPCVRKRYPLPPLLKRRPKRKDRMRRGDSTSTRNSFFNSLNPPADMFLFF